MKGGKIELPETIFQFDTHPKTILYLKIFCRLEIFSTEIALAEDGRWLSVDYVNDPIDLRVHSKAPEGVPDNVVAGVANALAVYVVRRTRPVAQPARRADIILPL